MANIQKHHIYQMWKSDGTYLGVLQNVNSEFTISQDINTIGPGPIQIKVAQSADTSIVPVKAITTEDDKWIMTEDGRGLVTEGEPANYAVDKSKIRNGNLVQITEVSDYYPAGKIVYTGKVLKWRVNFGTDDDATLYVSPRSFDMNGHLVKSNPIAVYSQTLSNQSSTIFGGQNGDRYAYFFDYAAFNITNITGITAKLAAQSGGTPATVTVTLVEAGVNLSDSGASIIAVLNALGDPSRQVASQSVVVSSTSPGDYNFNFPMPVQLRTNLTSYALLVTSTGSSGTGAIVYNTDTDVTSGFQFANVSGTWQIGYLTGEMYFTVYSIPPYTKATITNFEPSALLTQMITNYGSEGGVVTTSPGTITTTGITIPSYTFSVNLVTEGLDILLGLSPSNFYYTVDPGTNVLTFKPYNTTADYKLIFRTHIQTLDFGASIENLQNNVYLTGGLVSGSNVFKQQQNLISQNNFGVTIGRYNDPNVVNSSTASQLAANYLDRNDDELYETTVTIPDTAMDITLFKPGQTVQIVNLGTFIDTQILPIVRIDRNYREVKLSLGSVPRRQASTINDVQSQIDTISTVDNPVQPS